MGKNVALNYGMKKLETAAEIVWYDIFWLSSFNRKTQNFNQFHVMSPPHLSVVCNYYNHCVLCVSFLSKRILKLEP